MARRTVWLKEAKSSVSLGCRSSTSVVLQFRAVGARTKPARASSSPSRERASLSRENTSTVRRSTRRSRCATSTRASTAAAHWPRGSASPNRSTRSTRNPGRARLDPASMTKAPAQQPSGARSRTLSDSTPRRANVHSARWGSGNRTPAAARDRSFASHSADSSRSSSTPEGSSLRLAALVRIIVTYHLSRTVGWGKKAEAPHYRLHVSFVQRQPAGSRRSCGLHNTCRPETLHDRDRSGRTRPVFRAATQPRRYVSVTGELYHLMAGNIATIVWIQHPKSTISQKSCATQPGTRLDFGRCKDRALLR